MNQTAILVAQLSTAAGIRAPLGDISGQMFLELSRAIEAQGVSRKVVADMFGLALRGYQKKIQRLSESATETGTSLWEAILSHVREDGPTTRRSVESRFEHDDYLSVGAVLNDLVTSGLIHKTGSGETALYGWPETFNTTGAAQVGNGEALQGMIQLLVYREPGISAASLAAQLSLSEKEVNAVIHVLIREGVICLRETGGYETTSLVIPVGAEEGWETAVFDHFQAVAAAIGKKLKAQTLRSARDDTIGGCTLTFDIGTEHPYRDEVLQLLTKTRKETDDLWAKVHTWNQEHAPDEERTRVSFYFGQSVTSQSEEIE